MSDFDLAGGRWGYRLRTTGGIAGFEVYIEANTFTDQPAPQYEGRMLDTQIYVGPMSDGEVLLERHNWYNQGAHYRSVAANYPSYPAITVVDYANLYACAPFLPGNELIVRRDASVDLATLLPLLSRSEVTSDPWRLYATLSLLSSCAATAAQRTQLADALALGPGARDTLMRFGVLLHDRVGTFSAEDIAAIQATLSLFPSPVVDQLHLLVMDESLYSFGAAGTFGSGGLIILAEHMPRLASFVAYPDGGGQLPSVAQFQAVLVHEIGHMLDAASVGYEADRYSSIYTAGASDPNAYIYKTIFPLRTEDIIFYWLGYCVDSRTILDAVAARGNAVLSQKLSHAIDMMPSLAHGTAPFFTTDPVTHVTTVRTVPVTRGPSLYLGDDGMITSVDGIAF